MIFKQKRAVLELPFSFPRLTKTIAYENRIIIYLDSRCFEKVACLIKKCLLNFPVIQPGWQKKYKNIFF